MTLTDVERRTLERRSRKGRAEDARRARWMLWLAAGASGAQIRGLLRCGDTYIARWSRRFATERRAGLYSRHRGQPATGLTPKVDARILDWTRRGPQDGTTHWSTRRLAKALGLSPMMGARVWARHGLKPHRLERAMASDDPDFERKAADILGLYVNPPQHAAVFCVDEKTALQALDRVDPVRPLSPGRVERHGFEYFRHGTRSRYAAFNTKTGEVLGKTAERHTSTEFVAFLTDLVAHQPRGQAIHVILDHLSAHKTNHVEAFLQDHPTVRLHFTPTYSSWLNHVELWFATIERALIARGIFTSRHDLKRKIMRYIRQYNTSANPVTWKYADPRRITATLPVTGH